MTFENTLTQAGLFRQILLRDFPVLIIILPVIYIVSLVRFLTQLYFL